MLIMRLGRISTALLVIVMMCGPLPLSPDENPENAKAIILAINGLEKYAQLIETDAGTAVGIRFGLVNSWCIDSITFRQWINNDESGTTSVLANPWENDTIDTSFVFASPGTGSLLYTVFRSGARPIDKKLIFNVAESHTNHPPVWNVAKIDRTSMKGDRAVVNLTQYATDSDDDVLSFSISVSGNTDFTIDDDSLLVTGGSLDTGSYEIKVTTSDGVSTASATVKWTIVPVAEVNCETVSDTVLTGAGEKIAIDVLKNDRIVSGGGTLHVTSAGGCEHGTVSCGDTTVSYVSQSGYSGTDRFYYIVNDHDTGWVYLIVEGITEIRTVTFDKNDPSATGSMLPQTVASGSSVLLTINAFVKNGWSFQGWSTTPDDNAEYDDKAMYTMGSVNITLYAIWKVNCYQLVFNRNTGTGEPPATASYPYDTSIVIPDGGALRKDGFDFTGWNTRADGSGTAYLQDTSLVMGTADVLLFAQWKKKAFTISVSADDHGAVGDVVLTVEYGESSPAITATPESGYEFTGWTGDATGTANPLIIVNVRGDIAIRATFNAMKDTVMFIAATGGKISGIPVQYVDYGASCAAVTAVPDGGYYFMGWTSADGFMSTVNPLLIDSVTTNRTITAHFAVSKDEGDTSLVAYWSFDAALGNIYYDVTGHGYNVSSEGVSLVEGIRGKALHCPGSGFELIVANSADKFNLSRYTIETWFYTDVNLEETAVLMKLFDFQMINTGIYNGYGLQVDVGGNVVFSCANGDHAWVVVRSTTLLQPQRWYHIVGTYDGEEMKVYIDGELERSIFFSGTYEVPDADARIGCQTLTNEAVRHHVNGKLDEMKLYRRALSAETVKEHYLALRPN